MVFVYTLRFSQQLLIEVRYNRLNFKELKIKIS